MTEIDSPEAQAEASAIQAARLARRIHEEEVGAITKQFPFVHHDVAFCSALHTELHRIRAENSELSLTDAAKQLQQSVANNPELAALKPAYDKLMGEIGRYNLGIGGDRWIKDPSCWEKFVAAERAKTGVGVALAS